MEGWTDGTQHYVGTNEAATADAVAGLTEDDLEPTEGRREDLISLLEVRLGYAPANAEHDVDQILGGARVVPKDVADESNHTGTSSAQEKPLFARQYANGHAPASEAFSASDRPYESKAWGASSASEAESGSSMYAGMASPWRAAAAVAALGTVGVTLMLRARRRSQRKHLVIPLPTQAESTQAVEAVGRAAESGWQYAGSGWKYLRSAVALLVGGVAGWGIRRYQAM